jgi:lipid A ethanolaminephosphotransferase
MPSLLPQLHWPTRVVDAADSPTAPPHRRPVTITLTSGQLVVAASVFWALAFNGAFFSAVTNGRQAGDASAWGLAFAVAGGLVALNVFLGGLLAHRHTVKPLLAVLTMAAAAGSWFIGAYGAVLDPSMLRNVLRTDVAEAGELMNVRFLMHMALFAMLPVLLLWRVRVARQPWGRALARRIAMLLGALLVLVGLIWSVFQPLSSLTRNHRELRYLVTPANLLWSTSSVLVADARGATKPREPIGLDARAGPSWAARTRPMVVVVVIGETARAANWGLNGYSRQTTPELAQAGVVNFTDVTSCGTNTETSLPCMFAPVGRRSYDETRIRGQQSLLHVLVRAGVATDWRDNQSGCKGVCEGLPMQVIDTKVAPGRCDGDHCFDEVLTQDLALRLKQAKGTQLWVLHTLGNHGPSYFRRYPPAFARFLPECRTDDLRQCTQEQVVNAYDNALLYTDPLLATAIRTLQAAAADVDTALVYVSDHGESLGERGLFLHGLPYALAPDVQKRVPMVWWNSAGFERASGLNSGCLMASMAAQAGKPVTHDHLFHTLLGALDVRTALHEPSLDLTQPCRAAKAL